MKRDWWSCDGAGKVTENASLSASDGMPSTQSGITRRGALATLGLGAVWWASNQNALAQIAVNTDQGRGHDNVLVVIFLRGGADGLNMVAPYAEDAYHRARPSLRLRSPKDGSSSAGDRALDLDGFFGLHPALEPLLSIYKSGDLAIVQAVGSDDETRSHFEAMNAMERGLPEQKHADQSGWLARHLSIAPASSSSPLRAVAFASTMPDSLRGATDAVALQSLSEYRLGLGESRAEWLREKLARCYVPSKDEVSQAGYGTLRVLEALNRLDPSSYKASRGAAYPVTSLGDGLRQVAFLVKAQLGLEIACLDMGGWDTHVAQGASTGWQAGLLRELGAALSAFHMDLGQQSKSVTVVVQTEFGRRLQENTGLGTDHGHASVMFILGGGTKGGKVYARWPGLEPGQLTGPGDLAATTDYRDVLAEILSKRLANDRHSEVFPGLAHSPLGIVA